MKSSELAISCPGLEPHLDELVRHCACRAAADLRLAEHLTGVEIWADDLEGQDQAWFRFQTSPEAAPDHYHLLIFCAAGSFCRAPAAWFGTVPRQEIWEQTAAPHDGSLQTAGEFDPRRAERFIYHNFLLARDLAAADLVPAEIPSGQVEAFQALWAVTVDGRLARRQLPHYDLATRRARFTRIFAPAGVLLPDHWQLFQALWDGGVTGQKEVLDLVRFLPRL